MKALLFLLLCLPALAGERWFQLRVSESVTTTNYFLPAGRVVQLVGLDTPPNTLFFSAKLPEGVIQPVPVASIGDSSGNHFLGPATLSLKWTGQFDSRIGVHIVTLHEFDAEPAGPVVNLTLTASTNLPAFKPAATFFQAVPTP